MPRLVWWALLVGALCASCGGDPEETDMIPNIDGYHPQVMPFDITGEAASLSVDALAVNSKVVLFGGIQNLGGALVVPGVQVPSGYVGVLDALVPYITYSGAIAGTRLNQAVEGPGVPDVNAAFFFSLLVNEGPVSPYANITHIDGDYGLVSPKPVAFFKENDQIGAAITLTVKFTTPANFANFGMRARGRLIPWQLLEGLAR